MESMSFHLGFVLGDEFVLPEGCDSVDVLRLPLMGKTSTGNPAKTKMEFWTKKFNLSEEASAQDKAWQSRLLVITEKRIFIVSEKAIDGDSQRQILPRSKSLNNKSSAMEIVDSIPMEEIASISLDLATNPGTWGDEAVVDSGRASASFRGNKIQQHTIAEQNLRLSSSPEPMAPILRILTKPSKFNRGEPYYFLLCQQDYPCIDADLEPLCTRADAGALANRLASLAAQWRTVHARENRFNHLQTIMRDGWNSVLFNMLVLVLIISNFGFTVIQLENKDPDMQHFYEDIDLAFTTIFAIGT